MHFDAPVVLLAAPLTALVIMLLAWWARSARVRRAETWSGALGRTARLGNRGTAPWLALVTICAMAALAGPRWGRQVVTTETQALDLVFAVDISRSMLAEDVEPSRLHRARREVRRLVQDLAGDRLGLIGFAGRSYVLSPLTIDGSALHLLLDALHPDLVSSGGTALAQAIRQGRDLLLASDRVADRVLVIFTDGEAHDSLPRVLDAAEELRRDGIRLVLVAEGETEGARIPVRSPEGELLGYHTDLEDNIVLTARRDDVLTAVADAARGALVPAGLDDQAGAVRDLVMGFKRAPESTASGAHDIPRAWIPLLAAIVLLWTHTVTRRTAALAGVMLCVLAPARAAAQRPVNAADDAWRTGELERAAQLYRQQARAGEGGDTALYNAGTAALAVGRFPGATELLEQAAESLDPELRFRALYNLGLAYLRRAEVDSGNRVEHLAQARRRYREALLLRPRDRAAKWNYELALDVSPPSGGGADSGPAPPVPQGGAGTPPPEPTRLSREQAEQILQSIAAEERQTRMDVSRRSAQVRDRRRERDW